MRYLKRFYGTLDGGGHTLSGLAIDIGTDPLTADKNFGWLEENYGTIQNVTFSDVSITGGVCHTGAWAFIGVVAGTNDYEGLIENVQIENVNISVNRNMARIGGYVGVNKGTIKDCDAGHVLFGDPKVTMFSNGDMGIICGENIGTVDNCRVYFVTINYYPSVENRSVGGIVGYCKSGTISSAIIVRGSSAVTVRHLTPLRWTIFDSLHLGDTLAICLKGTVFAEVIGRTGRLSNLSKSASPQPLSLRTTGNP